MADSPPGLRIRVPLELSIPRFLTRAGYQVQSTPATRSTRALFDTPDRRLAAGGGELSQHARDGWLWRRDPTHPKLAAREWTAPAEVPEQQILDWTRAYRRGRPITPRASVMVHSRRHQVSSAHSHPLMTLVEERLDEQVASRTTARLRHVKVVESDSDAATAIAVLHNIALDDAPTLALLRPALVRAPRLRLPDPDSTGARELFTRSTTLSLMQWLYFDCELSAGSPDALRKLRVALRRLRSDLQTFAPVLDRDWASALRAELGELATRLGVVRDAEVLSERLTGLVALLPPSDRQAALPLRDTAGAQLAAARAELVAELAHQQYLDVLEHVMAAVTAPRWADGDVDPRVSRLARRPWRRLRDYVQAIHDTPDDAQLHRIRILAKRARYAADACVPAVGDPAARSAAQLAALQTVLGDHHDAAVTREWLQRQAVAMSGVSFSAGEMAALELGRLNDAAAKWPEAWSNASRAQDWRWLRS